MTFQRISIVIYCIPSDTKNDNTKGANWINTWNLHI